MSLQTGLDGCKVGFPGGETVNQLLPLLLAKGTVCAVAHNNFSLCLVDFAVHHLGPNSVNNESLNVISSDLQLLLHGVKGDLLEFHRHAHECQQTHLGHVLLMGQAKRIDEVFVTLVNFTYAASFALTKMVNRSWMSSPSRKRTGFRVSRWSNKKVLGSLRARTIHLWASTRACEALSSV